ncbi:MAG: ABC transporter ATP-binding protein [Oceanospirillaceae bacterium]
MKDSVTAENLLSMRGVKISAEIDGNWQDIVHGVDIDLKPGEVLGLIGESGAGKSTLGLAAMGYSRSGCKISEGAITFKGQRLDQMSEKQLQRLRGSKIAYVAQSAAASFNPAHKLIDQYCETPVQHNIASREHSELEAIALYRQLQLPNPESIGFRYPHQISGGQLQRAMTAMAMACKPDLIIFDEPTTALDVTTQIEVLSAIKEIVSTYNTAAIYITHDLAVVAQMADRIQVLKQGNTMEIASTEKMLSDPQHDYTKTLWAVREMSRTAKVLSDDYVVEVKNITATYPGNDLPVLKDVSFKVPRGQTTAVVGESGSGKSTTARVIMGLLQAQQGSVIFNQKTLHKNYRKRSKTELRNIQMIYQMADTALNPKQPIYEIIGRPLAFYQGIKGEENKRRVRELLTLIDLDPDIYYSRLPGELSGGQKQRVSIARALAAEAELIICDEVTSALDQVVAEGILKLLDRLQQEYNLSYLFITHDLATVRAIADQVIVMYQGKVVDQAPTEALFKPPYHPYTEKLLSSVPQMDSHWLDNLLLARANKENEKANEHN